MNGFYIPASNGERVVVTVRPKAHVYHHGASIDHKWQRAGGGQKITVHHK